MNRINNFLKNPIFISFLSIAGLFFALLFDTIQDYLGATELIFGLFFAVLIIIFVVVITSRFSNLKRQEDFEDKLNELTNIITATNMTWLVSEKYVSNLERHSETTWVFGLDLEKDLNLNGHIYQAIKQNLSKGFKYVYFLPRQSHTIKKINDFCRLYDFETNQVTFYLIPSPEFKFFTDVYVYDANHKVEQKVVMLLPNRKHDFYIELDDLRSDQTIGIGHTYIEKYSPYRVRDEITNE